jgi:hypothetical protein
MNGAPHRQHMSYNPCIAHFSFYQMKQLLHDMKDIAALQSGLRPGWSR